MLKTPARRMPKEKSHKEFYKGLLDKNKELRYPAKHSVKLKKKANVEKLNGCLSQKKKLARTIKLQAFCFFYKKAKRNAT